MNKWEELVGVEFGDLTVIEYLSKSRYKDGGTYHLYKCRCKCGREINVRSSNIKSQVSCRWCFTYRQHFIGKKYPFPNYVWNRLKNRSIAKNLECTITPEYLERLFVEQGGKCALTGVELKFSSTSSSARQRDTTASPDRIDSSKGYIPGNVRWVHKRINMMKNDMSDEEFKEWCRKIVDKNIQ